MWLCPDPGSVDDVDLVVRLVGMPLFVEYRYVLEADGQELGRLRLAVLIMVRIGPRVKSPALPTLVNNYRIPDLVSLDHTLEIKILCET